MQYKNSGSQQHNWGWWYSGLNFAQDAVDLGSLFVQPFFFEILLDSENEARRDFQFVYEKNSLTT